MAGERSDSRTTRAALLEAGAGCLGESGFAQLNLRSVADRAGTPVSQIHYHFGGKEGLLLGILEHQNAQLLARQRAMYGSDMPLWKRWQQACDYLEEDLASGYVRVLQELIAVGWSDEAVAAAVRAQLEGWVEVLTAVAREAVDELGLAGLSPAHVAALVGCLFLGAEQATLLGMGESLDITGALRSLGDVLRQAEEAG